MIKAIVFDLDDTLYRQEVPFVAAIKLVFPQLIEEELTPLFKLFRTISDHLYKQSRQEDGPSMLEVNHLRLSKALEAYYGLKVTEGLTSLFEREYTQQLTQICLSPPLKTILQQLTKNYRLGIITNGYTQRQETKLSSLKLSEIIPKENILISEKVGLEKPDHLIFELMAQRFALHETKSLLYIGDHYKNDVIGAKQAGWQAWWFNHQQREVPHGEIEVFDKEIKRFNGLVDELSLLL